LPSFFENALLPARFIPGIVAELLPSFIFLKRNPRSRVSFRPSFRIEATQDYNQKSVYNRPAKLPLLLPPVGFVVNRFCSLVRRGVFAFPFLIGLLLLPTESLAQDNKAKSREELVASLAKTYEPREFVGTNKLSLKYRLLKPIQYVPGKKYPLVLFLHGAGERGDDNQITLVHGAKEFADAKRREQYPCYVVVPQCPKDRKWSEVDWSLASSDLPKEASLPMQSVKELLDEMVENAGVDPSRIYITGLSMGGYGTWDAIARYPNFFAAAVPICGGGDPKTVNLFPRLPIWCFHGDSDSAVKVSRSREMVEALKAVGSRIKYTEYPGVQHDSWTASYANPELYQWMFSQQKAAD
jgi:predicted peptidase